MRTIGTTLFLIFSAPLIGQTNKIAGEIAEHTLGPITKEAAEKAATELVENAVKSTGKQVAQATEEQLAKAIGQYGKAVVIAAQRVPEATTALAMRAPQLLPLVEQLGDDILRIEARAPGFAELAAKNYGKDEIPRLLKLSEPEMKGVLAVSTHTTDPRAAKLLLEATEKDGMTFLDKVSGTQILAAGLSAAAILAVYNTTDKIPPGPEIVEHGANLIHKLLSPVSIVAASLLAVWGGLAIWRSHQRT